MNLYYQFPENLTEQDKHVLDFETAHPGQVSGRKADKIRAEFGPNYSTRYAQHLNKVVDHPQALIHAPATVARVKAARSRARAARAARGASDATQ